MHYISSTTACILAILIHHAYAQQSRYPPVSAPQQRTVAQNPWGLIPLHNGSTKKKFLVPYQAQQQHQQVKKVQPPPPTYLPSQLNPVSRLSTSTPPLPHNYNTPPPPASDISSVDPWSSWTNFGGAFRHQPGVDHSPTYGDIVAAINVVGTLKVKSIGSTGTSAWITVAIPTATIIPNSRPAVAVNSGNFQVFMIGTDGRFYRLPFPPILPLATALSSSWTTVNTDLFINNPAAVVVGSDYFVFGINRNDRNIYRATITSSGSNTAFTIIEAGRSFAFSPTASTYIYGGVIRTVVAGVTFNGDLLVSDVGLFQKTDLSCIESPQSVSLGDQVEVYCRASDMNFYCVTIQQGGITDTRILPEIDLPDVFDPVYHALDKTVVVYSKTPAGRVVSKLFQ